MDNQRLLIWAFFGLMGWITYQTWVQDYAPQPVAATTQQVEPLEMPIDDDDSGDLPELSAVDDASLDAEMSIGDEEPEVTAAPTAPTIRVTTDVLDIEISTDGGTLQSANLLAYPIAKDQPNMLVQLLSTDPSNVGLIRTGLRTMEEGNRPNYKKHFSSDADSYDLGSADELVVMLSRPGADGISVEKRLRFKRGSYAIEIEHEITNRSEGLWRGAEYAQIIRISKEQERSMFDVDSYSFAGPIVFDGEKSEKLKRGDLLEDGAYDFKSQAGWIGSIQHHFLSAVATVEVSDKRKSINLGRADDNDVVVKGNLISRIHAKIEMRRGKFVIVDQSTNGTFLQNVQGQEVFVRRDSTELGKEGTIGLGRTEAPGSSLAIYYKTID